MLWQVPITIATSKNPAAVKFVLCEMSATVTVEGVGPDDWILVSQCQRNVNLITHSANQIRLKSLINDYMHQAS